ncbi:MAG: polyprenyl synthetase family protein [Candidatus Erginobacter occultus]|nr:polyprenyl synthetase family protein [Candidatus Erginobacter occultus]
MNANQLQVYLEEKRGVIELALADLLDRGEGIPSRLREAMAYSLLGGGKRIRPIIALCACRAAGGLEAPALCAACALEMIHCYSLIHDDLPAMDDDDLRRGRPSLHRAFDEGTAILAGDALLTLAFEVVARDRSLSAARAREIIAELSAAAGDRGMVGGQQADLDAEGGEISREELARIHSRKTGALITAAAVTGAIAGGGEKELVGMMRAYGGEIGLAFQIKDDLLDVEGNEKALGKAVGQDRRGGKATYPAVWGIEESREELKRAVVRAEAALEGLGEEAEPLRMIARFIARRES